MKNLILLSIIFISQLTFAKTIFYGSEAENIYVAYGTDYVFRFPLDVMTITQASRFDIGPVNPGSPSYSTLKVRARFQTGVNVVNFFLSDGKVIRTKITIISKVDTSNMDSVYDFKAKDTLFSNSADSKAGASIADLDLMKAIIRSDDIQGYSASNLDQEVIPGFKGVSTRLVRKYTGGQFNGYVFEITNITKQKLFINNQNLTLGDPNQALLSSVDDPILEPRGKPGAKSYLRIVAKPTSTYSKLILPIQIVERGGKNE